MADRELRREFVAFGDVGERYFRPLVGALLSQVVCSDGRYDEALAITNDVEALAAGDDIEAQALWRSVRAKVFARTGRITEAVQLAQRAVVIVASAEAPVLMGDMLVDEATVLGQAGRMDDAADALAVARELYAHKGATLPLRRVEALRIGFDALLGGGVLETVLLGPARARPGNSGSDEVARAETSWGC